MPNLQSSTNCWRALEQIRGLSAVPAIWQRHLGDHVDCFRRAFLLARPEPAKHFPCEKCGCAHEVIPLSDAVSLSPSDRERASLPSVGFAKEGVRGCGEG